MSRSLLALCAGLLLGTTACGHAQQAADKPAAPVAANGLKHMVRPVEATADLDGNSLPTVFEQVFCSAMFELNAKQVVCADQVRALMSYQRERALTGGEAMSLAEVARSFEAPREVVLNARREGETVVVSALVVDAQGTALGRMQIGLSSDGADLTARARELAAQVVALP